MTTQIFSTLLSHPPTASIWSDQTRTRYFLRFEAALATVQARLGIIPQNAADAIVKACHDDGAAAWLDYEELRQETERIGYPVLGVVRMLVAYVNGLDHGGGAERAETEAKLGEWAHWGATTQDVTDTAAVLQIRDTLVVVGEMLDTIIDALRAICEDENLTAKPMAARSNLQQAVPMTVGFKFARLLATFARHRRRLAEVRERVLVLEFGGAAGTLATLSPDGSDEIGLRCQEALADELGLQLPEIAWHTERDRVAEYGFFLTLITSTCAKFALDLKLEMQTEVGEMSEPYARDRGSSSTMPQKRNPIGCAYITATAAAVRQLGAALAESMVGDHERSTGPWEIEWIALPQISSLAAACLRHTADLLRGLEFHPDAMRANLDLTKGAVVSEAVMMALAPKLGRQRAHDLIYDLCREAIVSRRPLVELLERHHAADVGVDELKRLCDPANYLGLSRVMTRRVLEGV